VVRHYLNRIDDTASNDEWSYISQLGSDVEFKDVMEVNQRYITFDRRLRRKVKPPKTKLEATKEGIRWALDAAGNTGQYIKFVNMTIDKRQAEIDKIKKLQNKFDHEIEMLNSHKIKKLNNDNKNSIIPDAHTVSEYLNQLLLEKRLTQNNLQNLHGDLSSINNELKMQEKQIEQVQKHIKAKILEGIKNETHLTTLQAIKMIRVELESISQQYDVSKLTSAVDTVISSKNSK
jgi:hypothetical protein